MKPQPISFKQLARRKFKTLPFDGIWYDSFGMPERNARWFVFGPSGSGKTSFLIQLALYCTNFGRVAYVSSEEGVSESFRKAVVRANADDKALRRVLLYGHLTYDELRAEIETRKNVKLWILDSINFLGYTMQETYDLMMEYRNTMIAIIGWGAGNSPDGASGKASRFRADIKITLKHFQTIDINSRYGGNGQPFIVNYQQAAKYDAAIALQLHQMETLTIDN